MSEAIGGDFDRRLSKPEQMPRSLFQCRMPVEEKRDLEWAAALDNETSSAFVRRLVKEDVEQKRAELKAAEDAESERRQLMNLAFPGQSRD